MIKVLKWNAREPGKPAFFPSFHRLDQLHHPSLCIILETRLSASALDRFHRRFLRKWKFYAIQSQDLFGGIVVVWDRGIVRVDMFHRCSRHVAIVIFEFNEVT